MIKRSYFIRATRSRNLNDIDGYVQAIVTVKSWRADREKALDAFKVLANKEFKWVSEECRLAHVVAFNRV